MATLKLNKIVSLMIFSLLLCCEKTIVKKYSDDDCATFVAAKKGFRINIYSKDFKENEVIFRSGNRKLIPMKKEIEVENTSFFIKDNLKLRDTLSVVYRGNVYQIYDFKNVRETAVDGSDHKNIEICRISTAKINGEIIPDSNNNILKVVLK